MLQAKYLACLSTHLRTVSHFAGLLSTLSLSALLPAVLREVKQSKGYLSSGTSVAKESLFQRSIGSSVSERRSSASIQNSLAFMSGRLFWLASGRKIFSSQVAFFTARSRRSSFSIVYNAKLKIFTDWWAEWEIFQFSLFLSSTYMQSVSLRV